MVSVRSGGRGEGGRREREVRTEEEWKKGEGMKGSLEVMGEENQVRVVLDGTRLYCACSGSNDVVGAGASPHMCLPHPHCPSPFRY